MSRWAHATLLFSEPDFISGMGSVLDLGATAVQFNVSDSVKEADMVALRSDLMAVGADLVRAAQERFQSARAT